MGGQTASDMDGGWKQLIDDFLEDFFLFFFPAIHSLIDFREKCQLLDKELAALVAGSATGRRHVDKLIEVHWKDGRRDLLLVHVEVQAQEDSDFARRMFVYNSRIRIDTDDRWSAWRCWSTTIRLFDRTNIIAKWRAASYDSPTRW